VDKRASCCRRSTPQCGIHELERRRPTLGATREIRQNIGLERVSVRIAEESFGFHPVEAKILRRELRDLALGSQPSNGERRRTAA